MPNIYTSSDDLPPPQQYQEPLEYIHNANAGWVGRQHVENLRSDLERRLEINRRQHDELLQQLSGTQRRAEGAEATLAEAQQRQEDVAEAGTQTVEPPVCQSTGTGTQDDDGFPGPNTGDDALASPPWTARDRAATSVRSPPSSPPLVPPSTGKRQRQYAVEPAAEQQGEPSHLGEDEGELAERPPPKKHKADDLATTFANWQASLFSWDPARSQVLPLANDLALSAQVLPLANDPALSAQV